jgi:hypothetical protein
MTVRSILCSLAIAAGAFASDGAPGGYAGVPYHDSVFKGGPQRIPGRVQCVFFDLGGEGVAYHTVDKRNQGSGELNPADGTYLNEFRKNEAIGTSYTKLHDSIDRNPFNLVQPPENQLYVGWTTAGEWFKITVAVGRAGTFTVDLLYTSNRGGDISLDLNGRPLTSALRVLSTSSAGETIPWRQWHHWNLMKAIAVVDLPEGKNVLTLHVLTQGNMNLAWLDFERKG